MKKTVSVILPNYNYEKYISSRVDEVLAQTYPVSEIIILDDGSTDGSVKLIREKVKELKGQYPKVKIKTVFNAKNSGSVFGQWKKGVELATSDYIWIAEMDDSSDKKFLEKVMEPVLTEKGVVLSYTNSKLIGSVSLKDKMRGALDAVRRRHAAFDYVVDGVEELDKNLAVYNSIPNVSACVFKNTPSLPKILSVAKRYKLSGDWYFYIKLAGLGKVAYTQKKLNLHRLSASSVTGKTDYKTRFSELQKIHAEVVSSTKLSESTRKRIVALENKLKKNWGVK